MTHKTASAGGTNSRWLDEEEDGLVDNMVPFIGEGYVFRKKDI